MGREVVLVPPTGRPGDPPAEGEDHAFHSVTTQAAAGLAWTGVALLIGFALKVLLTRKMAPREMGIVLAAQAFVTLVVVVATLGIPEAVLRFIGIETRRDAAPRGTVYLGVKIVAAAGVGTAAAVIAVLLSNLGPAMSADALWAMAIATCALPLLAAGDVLGAAFRGVNRLSTKIVLFDVARPGLVMIALLLSPLALTRHAPYVAGLYAAAALVTCAAGWGVFRRDSRWEHGGRATPVALLRFGMPLAGAALLAGPVVNNLVPLMLSAWSGATPVAYYSVVLALQGLVYLPVAILELAATPTWTQWAATGQADWLARSFRRNATMSLAATATVGLVITSNNTTLLTLLFGATFTIASGALTVATLATLWSAFMGPSDGMLRAMGLATTIFKVRVAAAAVGIVVGGLLIPDFGLAGGVGAFAAATVALSTFYGLVLYRASGIHPFTRSHLLTAALAAAGVLAGTAGARAYPLAGGVAAHLLALAVLVVNADLRLAVRTLLTR